MNIGDRIRIYRLQKKMTLEELSKKVGVSRQTLSRYETGIISNIPSDKIELIASAVEVPPGNLMGWENNESEFLHVTSLNNEKLEKWGITPIKTKRIPLLGEIACGKPIWANEDRESYIEVGTDIRADFCLKCKGDSMINARILDGDIVFIREQPQVENGEIAAVVIDDEATLKRIYIDNGFITLQSENPAYSPIVVKQGEVKNIRILGKAIAFQSDVK